MENWVSVPGIVKSALTSSHELNTVNTHTSEQAKASIQSVRSAFRNIAPQYAESIFN